MIRTTSRRRLSQMTLFTFFTTSKMKFVNFARYSAALLLAVALPACAQRDVPTSATPRAATSNAEIDSRNVVLQGTIVTMDAQRSVHADGAMWIRDGVIVAVAASRSALNTMQPDAAKVPTLRVDGVIYPGMIDLHNHPEYAIYPLLPITRKYKDRYEWRFYDDDYARRITHLNTVLNQPFYLDLGAEVSRYGELKALVGGTTALQGSRTGQPTAREECLVRNIETSPVTPRMAFSRVDIGRDAQEWRTMAEERAKGPIVIHLAEGVGSRMANEFDAIKRSGLVGPELIAIHGVGLTESQFKEMADVGAKLVWSPLSNFMLYGQTANIDAARRAGVAISLAPDWAPSGSKSILGELKVADLVNRNALKTPFTDRELVEMVTLNPAQAMGWEGRLGRLAAGHLADIVIMDKIVAEPYRNLIVAIEENIQLVMIRGDALYGDQALVRRFKQLLPNERMDIGARQKAIRINCAAPSVSATPVAPSVVPLPQLTLNQVNARLQEGLDLDPAMFAKRVSIVQFTRDFLTCGAGKPSDPPTAADAATLLKCRFGLPFEKTVLSPLATNQDADFFPRLNAIPHMPGYLRGLSDYYTVSDAMRAR
jgi:5-methylthioadenosine/S-adenosylhomocysteine deaminase